MAELRHSLSSGSRTTASPHEGSTPLTTPVSISNEHRHSRDRFRLFFINEESRFPLSHVFNSNISRFLLLAILFAALLSFSSLLRRLSAPYLCVKDGIALRCPRVKEPPSLWENPYAATTSWKPCAERRVDAVADLPSENKTTGYIFIHAEGGLNQQRIAICNAVAVAKIMNATLILPVLKQDQIWKDQTLVLLD